MREPDTTQPHSVHPTARVSATVPDWSRERLTPGQYNPSRSLLACIRRYQTLQATHGPVALLERKFTVLAHRFWSAVTGADIPLTCKLGGGLLLPHPNGVVVHPDAEIGPNCLLFQGVTLGAGGRVPGLPILEGHVDVSAGAKIFGGVRIGAHARIGANAVVLCDVPAGCLAVGVPARIIQR